MVYQNRQLLPEISYGFSGNCRQDRTTIFVSPTDLSNMVVGVKNSNPALVQEIDDCILDLMNEVETEIKESAVEMKLSSGLCALRRLHFLRQPITRPILVAVAEASGQREIYLYSGVRYTNTRFSYILLFREIDTSFKIKFIGHSIRDSQLNNLFPIIPCHAIWISTASKSSIMASPVCFPDTFLTSPAIVHSPGLLSYQFILFKVQHSTIKYSIEQRFFKTKALLDLTTENVLEGTDFPSLYRVAEKWRCALLAALQESCFFLHEQNVSEAPSERRAEILHLHHDGANSVK